MGNKREERGWQAPWVKCSITVRFNRRRKHGSLIIRVGCDAMNTTVTIIRLCASSLSDNFLARSCACSPSLEPRAFVVDCRIADSYISQFLLDYLGGVLHRYDLHAFTRLKDQLTGSDQVNYTWACSLVLWRVSS